MEKDLFPKSLIEMQDEKARDSKKDAGLGNSDTSEKSKSEFSFENRLSFSTFRISKSKQF